MTKKQKFFLSIALYFLVFPIIIGVINFLPLILSVGGIGLVGFLLCYLWFRSLEIVYVGSSKIIEGFRETYERKITPHEIKDTDKEYIRLRKIVRNEKKSSLSHQKQQKRLLNIRLTFYFILGVITAGILTFVFVKYGWVVFSISGDILFNLLE